MRIDQKFMLAAVTMRKPKATRTDQKAQAAIAQAVRDAGGVTADARDIGKGIIELYSKGAILQVLTHYNSFNTYHQAVTVEYVGGRGAPRLLAIGNHKEHSDRYYNAFLAWQQSLVNQFVPAFEAELETAEKRLGPTFFHREDYPSAESIQSNFQFTCNYMPIADPSSFQMGAFAEQQSAELEKALTDAVADAAQNATVQYRDRMRKALQKLAAQLRNGDRLHGSLLSNVQALVSADLNVIQDAEFDQILTGLADGNVEAQVTTALATRENSDKSAAADSVDAIDKKLAGLF